MDRDTTHEEQPEQQAYMNLAKADDGKLMLSIPTLGVYRDATPSEILLFELKNHLATLTGVLNHLGVTWLKKQKQPAPVTRTMPPVPPNLRSV